MQFEDRIESRLANQVRRWDRLRAHFKEFSDSLRYLQHENFVLPGISSVLSEDGELIQLTYRRIAIDLVLTMERVDARFRGRVTAILVKHPLRDEPRVLDSFSYDLEGETDMRSDATDEMVYLYGASVRVVLSLMERAILLDSE